MKPTCPDPIGELTEAFRKATKELDALVEPLTQLGYELMVLFGRLPGRLDRVIRLTNSGRWVVAGRWLLHDDDVAMPMGLWQRVLSGMVHGVRSGRHLADGGF